MRREQTGALVVTLLACATFVACRSEPAPPPAPPPASSVFSAEVAARLPLAELEDGGAPVAKVPVPGVLAEIVAATPKPSATPTGPDGGTRVGTETGVPDDSRKGPSEPDGGVDASARTKGTGKRIKIAEGSLDVSEGIPSPAVERAARAQLYYPLVQRCRGPDGQILPPDTVVLRFRIDVDGYIVPASISAIAEDSRYEAAANCMQRELSAAAFRAPAAARGVATIVNATVPSVD